MMGGCWLLPTEGTSEAGYQVDSVTSSPEVAPLLEETMRSWSMEPYRARASGLMASELFQ